MDGTNSLPRWVRYSSVFSFPDAPSENDKRRQPALAAAGAPAAAVCLLPPKRASTDIVQKRAPQEVAAPRGKRMKEEPAQTLKRKLESAKQLGDFLS